MKVTFWGVRGSIPVPGHATARYGGNTSCLSVEEGSDLLVLDAGTGIRRLGEALASRGHTGPIDVVLSHAHMDHVQGLPFFGPVHDPGRTLRVFGPAQEAGSLHGALGSLMKPPFWPAQFSATADRLAVTEIKSEEFRVASFDIRTVPLRHPGRTLGFSITRGSGGESLNYLTDNELGPWSGMPEWQSRLVGFLRNGAVLVHDATFGDDVIRDRIGWGHSSGGQAVDLAIAAGVRRLILFHHAPEHTDQRIDQLVDEARSRAARAGSALVVEAAAEGLSFDL
jgi:phosphoribosyl 1,2-cyclic phosphodiesterase